MGTFFIEDSFFGLPGLTTSNRLDEEILEEKKLTFDFFSSYKKDMLLKEECTIFRG